MAVKFTNNAATTLAAGINSSVTSIAVTDGSVFPAITGSDHFYVTFDDTTNKEIVKVTARSGNTLTAVRGQDDTTARAFSSGDKAELRIVAALLEDVKTDVSSTLTVDTFTGDGSATAFTLSVAPASEDNLIVFIEGVYQNPGDFVLSSGTTLTFDVAPANSRKIIVYHVAALVSGNNLNNDQFTCNGSTTAFTLSLSPIHENNTQVFLDGVYQQKTDYAVSGTTLTMDAAPANGAILEVMTFTQTEVNTLPANFVSGLTEVTAVGADHFMIFDATDSALKKSLVSDVLESATSISTSADATAITIDSSENVTFTAAVTTGTTLSIGGNNNELRFYEGANYVGFEAPALSADKIWVLPAADGSSGQVLSTDGSGTLSFATVSGTTINNNADNRVITGSGTANTLEGESNLVFNGSNLGIGTTSPAVPLDIVSNSGGNAVVLRARSADDYAFMIFKNNAGSAVTGQIYNHSGAIKFTTGTSATERLTIDTAGNVGIGTTSPSQKMEVAGNLAISSGYGLGWGNFAVQMYSDQTYLRIRTGSTDRMTINSNGRIGIGTTISSEAKLDIRDAVTGTWITRMENTSAGDGMLLLSAATLNSNSSANLVDVRSGGTGYGTNQAFKVDATNTCYINTTSIWGSAGAHALAIQFSGNKGTGIGFKQYSSSAGVQPLVFYNSGAGAAGSITYTYSSTSFNTSSDYRMKEKVEDMPSAMNMVKALKPKTFEWRIDPDDTLQYGFLAHEVQDIFPNAVTGDKDAMHPAVLYDSDDVAKDVYEEGHEKEGERINDWVEGDVKEAEKINAQSIDHSKLVPLLVKTIQELEARITTLENA
ncbi:tail fiber domain-containing protein [Gammaproteobacteria bacterium]|nr:tail fiber domain-containing protein [Gammaproteobacteria bacterium]